MVGSWEGMQEEWRQSKACNFNFINLKSQFNLKGGGDYSMTTFA